VATAHFGHNFVVAIGRAHSIKFVGGDGHSNPRATNQDAPLYVAIGDLPTNMGGKIGIIDARLAIGSHILNLMTTGNQRRNQLGLNVYTAMIAAY
jgi:hypothetical protein